MGFLSSVKRALVKMTEQHVAAVVSVNGRNWQLRNHRDAERKTLKYIMREKQG